MKKTQEELLNEELGRFMSINKYVGTINEQELGGEEEVSTELPTGLDTETPELEDEVETEDEVSTEEPGGGLDDALSTTEELPMGDEEELETTEDSDTEEVDVTDLVDGQKELEEKFKSTEEKISQSVEKVDGVFSKLDDLEQKMGELDKLYNAIEDLGDKIEQAKPKTPEQKLELRSLDSYPYNQKLTDFFDDKEVEMDVTGKDEYVLTSDDVKNMSEKDVKDSFVAPDEVEEND